MIIALFAQDRASLKSQTQSPSHNCLFTHSCLSTTSFRKSGLSFTPRDAHRSYEHAKKYFLQQQVSKAPRLGTQFPSTSLFTLYSPKTYNMLGSQARPHRRRQIHRRDTSSSNNLPLRRMPESLPGRLTSRCIYPMRKRGRISLWAKLSIMVRMQCQDIWQNGMSVGKRLVAIEMRNCGSWVNSDESSWVSAVLGILLGFNG
jgi:hypothetical protein